jgi:hypothetical protein
MCTCVVCACLLQHGKCSIGGITFACALISTPSHTLFGQKVEDNELCVVCVVLSSKTSLL